MQAKSISPSVPVPETSCDALPLLLQGELRLAALLAPRREIQQLLPSPRLVVVPIPGGKTVTITAGLEVSGSPLGPFQVLQTGPLVTFAALREGLWGQRHSLGFYPLRTLVTTPEAARWLITTWGLAAEVGPLPLPAASEQTRSQAPAGLTLKGLFGSGFALQREAYLYTKREGRLCSSRLTLKGTARLTAGGARAPRLAGQAREQGLGAGGAPLASACLQGAQLACYGPGRCYDL